MLRVGQNERKVATMQRVIRAAKLFGCSRVNAHSHVRRFQKAGISTDAQDRLDVKKQRQDTTVNLHSCIDVSGSRLL